MANRSNVKWFDGKKGYGFIVNPNGGEDIFVHYSAISSELKYKLLDPGAQVEFELVATGKGLQAQNVKQLTPLVSEEPSDVNITGASGGGYDFR
jgi:cold shock protein